MRVSYNWLRELIPGLALSPTEVGERLTAVGLELEGTLPFGHGLAGLQLCSVAAIEPHPAREKLQLVTVDRGGATQRVVCGASNVPAPGGSVVLAPLGTHLPAVNLTLEPKKLGGIVSEGMLCSERELGLSSDAEGILTFEPGRFAAGTPFLTAFPTAEDTVFELGVTPNRPDALGHLGVARDLAAALELDWRPPEVRAPSRTLELRIDDVIQLDNRATERCPRYGAAMVQGVRVGRSPEWLRWRLNALGIRPISNVVDVTNLLLLEYGNPMHAFDLSQIRGGRIVIRTAEQKDSAAPTNTPKEQLTTLDGVTRDLGPEDLVIADAERPLALAGVMGGANSEISDQTQNVLLECAYFEPRGIRKTARRLGLHSDSSHRFERGVNWSGLPDVLRRASALLCELAGGSAVTEQRFADGTLPTLPEIPLRKAQLERLLGVDADFTRVLATLERLGFQVVQRRPEATPTEAVVRGHASRPDVAIEADLIEEYARIRGLDAIPTRLPRIAPGTPSPAGRLERDVRHWAASAGLFEAVTYSFVSASDLRAVHAPEPVVVLDNPLSSDRSVLTTSLLPGLLDALRRARRRGEGDVRLFTVAQRFLPPLAALPHAATQAARPRTEDDLGKLPEERLSFAAVLTGDRPSYLRKPEPLDVFDAKGLAVQLVEHLTGRSPTTVWSGAAPSPLPQLHPRGAARLLLDGIEVGNFGPLHPEVADVLEIDAPVQIVELDLAALEQLGKRAPKYRPIPRLPAIARDLAVEAPESLSAGTLTDTITAHAGPLCESVSLFDRFQNERMAAGHRSLAFRLTYRDPKASTDPDNAKTLTDDQVDRAHAKVVAALEALGAVPRT